MLKYGQEYVTQSMEEYEAEVKANMLKALEAEGGGDRLPTQSAAHAVGEWIQAVAIARQGLRPCTTLRT